MIRIVAFALILSHLSSVSNICAKFIDSEVIQRNAYKCRRLSVFADKKIDEFLDSKLVLSQLKKITDLCFIRCLYHTNGLSQWCAKLNSQQVNNNGNVLIDFIIPHLRSLAHHSVDEEFEIQADELVRLAKDIISVCHRSNAGSSEKLCLAAVKAVECLEAVLYLFKYGYLNSNNEDLPKFDFTPTVYRSAIIKFQTFFSLSVTGVLDFDSLEIMNSLRCGVMDAESRLESRNKRYDLYRVKWNFRRLTYRISKYTKKICKNSTDEEISRAFNAWTNVSGLAIEKSEIPNKADIIIRFEKRVHGDRVPFDGPGRILAHTFYPAIPMNQNQLHSFIHFDNAEKWTVHSSIGVNLYQIAMHEIGHALGLKHSSVKNSVMWPKHDGYVANYTLHGDDIDAIQALYGAAT